MMRQEIEFDVQTALALPDNNEPVDDGCVVISKL